MGILLGAVAAFVWGCAGVAGGLAARRLGARQTLAWSMLLSVIVAVPLALLSGAPGDLSPINLLGLVTVATGGLSGLMLVYAAMRLGNISVVTPISAAYGGVAAILSVLTGQTLTTTAMLALAAAVIGAVLASRGESSTPGLANARPGLSALLAGGAAIAWGVQLFVGGEIGEAVGQSWVVAFMRMAGVIVITLPLALRRELVFDKQALPLVAIAGIGEVAGFTLYLLASRYGIAEASVMTSQYGTVAAVIGVVILRERLQAIQLLGIAIIVVAVAALALAG